MTPQAILIGPPGAGKSAVGAALAKRLGTSFVDTDHLIEIDQGKNVSQIFIEDGESTFREIEKRICLAAIREESGVVSLGGGAVLDPLTQDALLESASPVIFLDASLKVVAPRIGFNRDRPLLLGNPRQKWQELMDLRRPIYLRVASLTYEVGERSVDEMVNDLVEKVKS